MKQIIKFASHEIAKKKIVQANGRTMEQVKADTGCDAITSFAMWNMASGKPCAITKADGVLLSDESWHETGIGWNKDGPFVQTADYEQYDNFIAHTPLIRNGKPEPKLRYKPELGGKQARTAMGIITHDMEPEDVELVIYSASFDDRTTLEGVRDELAAIGCTTATNLDGGGTTRADFGNGQIVSPEDPARRPTTYLCIWLDKPKPAPKPEEHKPATTYTVCLDPGHGPGCVNGSPDGVYKEHEFAWDMGLRLFHLLERQGIRVVMTRTAGGYPSLSTRCAVGNEAKADLFLSLHSNASPKPGWSAPRGLVIYTSAPGDREGRNVAARAIIKRLDSAGVRIRGGGLVHNRHLTVLARTISPAMILEYGFHTNREDVNLLSSNGYRAKLAEATARGVCDYLGIPYHADGISDTEAAVDKLHSAGVISDPGYWKGGEYSAANVQALIRSMADHL